MYGAANRELRLLPQGAQDRSDGRQEGTRTMTEQHRIRFMRLAVTVAAGTCAALIGLLFFWLVRYFLHAVGR